MSRLVYLPLNVRDYLADTVHLSAEESGCYLHLLMHAWISGGYLPDDNKRLAGIARVGKARWKVIRPVMLTFFHVCDKGWWQKRLLAELQTVSEKIEKNKNAGSLGGAAKALKDKEAAIANAMAEERRNQIQIQKEKEKKKKEESKKEEDSGLLARGPALDSTADDIFAIATEGFTEKEDVSIDTEEKAHPSVSPMAGLPPLSPEAQAECDAINARLAAQVKAANERAERREREVMAKQAGTTVSANVHQSHPVICGGRSVDVPF